MNAIARSHSQYPLRFGFGILEADPDSPGQVRITIETWSTENLQILQMKAQANSE